MFHSMSATNSGYTESVMVIPQKYKDNAEKNSIGVILQVATYNYINIYLLKYRFMVLRG